MSIEGLEIEQYRSDAIKAVSFNLVISPEDVDKVGNDKFTFKPVMAHQAFGETEMIFGYKGLRINLYYHHNSTKCLLDVDYDSEIDEIEVDDIFKMMNNWLPRNYFTDKQKFQKMIKKESNDKMFGQTFYTFELPDQDTLLGKANCTYKVTEVDANDEVFQEYHERFETFIIWFIDAANFIDLKDERWLIFYIYEEFEDPKTKKKIVTPVGYAAVYKFFLYPDSLRARISHFFILPSHQGRGLGTHLYKSIYKKIFNMPEITDITVEDPNGIFQKMRDYCDSLHIYRDLKEKGENIAVKNNKALCSYFTKHKISKRQGLRIADILQYLKAVESGPNEKSQFEEMLSQRFQQQQKNGELRLCKIARGSNDEDLKPEEVSEEVFRLEAKSYIDQLAPVVDKLFKETRQEGVC